MQYPRGEVGMWKDLDAPDVDRGTVDDNEPVEEHSLISFRDVCVRMVQRDHGLVLQSTCKGRRCGQHDLATDGDPSSEPRRHSTTVPRSEHSYPVILTLTHQRRILRVQPGPLTARSWPYASHLCQRRGNRHCTEEGDDAVS